MGGWVTRDEALKALRVRPQTLYAYVSRGKIGTQPDPNDPRRSLFRDDDIASLVKRRERGKRPEVIAASTMAFGEPIIETSISTIIQGRLHYRGRDAVELSATATLEETAALLWGAGSTPDFAPASRKPAPRRTGRLQAFETLAREAASGRPTFGRAPSVLHAEAASLVGCLGSAFGAAPDAGPLHTRLARAWKADGAAVDLIRRALVLLADQELTASAFAARVAASTGAALGACVLSGFATLSGPLHGGATALVRSLVEEVERTSAEEAIARHLNSGLAIPGFGHPLYPNGDPRAAELLARFDPPPRFKRLITQVSAATGQRPTIDVALAALPPRFGLPDDAPFTLFAIGRSIGWLAHGIEQVTSGAIIRPRARYIGPGLVTRG